MIIVFNFSFETEKRSCTFPPEPQRNCTKLKQMKSAYCIHCKHKELKSTHRAVAGEMMRGRGVIRLVLGSQQQQQQAPGRQFVM